MAWLIWLLIPVAATLVAALWTWLRNRPEPLPSTRQSMQAHTEYLDALAQTARSRDRGLQVADRAGEGGGIAEGEGDPDAAAAAS